MSKEISTMRPIHKYDGSQFYTKNDEIASEFPLTLQVNNIEFATMVCTPDQMEELVIGFLASEGVIRTADEIKSLSIQEETGFAYIQLNREVDLSPVHSKRFIGSCCGKSRQFYLQSDVRTAKTIMSRQVITVQDCQRLMRQVNSKFFQQTGGVHNAMLASKDGVVVIRMDIGRHNALDKIYGYCLSNRISLKDKVIAFSGRISSEVLLKVAKIGVGIILSKSAPTDLALDLAEELGITAVGFIRGDTLNVYTHPERIEGTGHTVQP
ncbi:formate dehydrogenase accessory sulfurtransferase FdhD [Brevibacillus daliensis]|uniref:formate dehydrogenase accessory sulfurtransferase FdhD n=1 Tax=Brevibacillus daliensis TaxID=2892995 RepID=UPI001E51DCF4|nr:formate dehydrogenase accessory sulfurtransferase FdhD [Brevibacillus daliensis]